MNISERQALLSAFKQRETTKTTIHCRASGIAIEINAPKMPAIFPLLYSGVSPFASIDTCLEIAKQRYSKGHCDMAPTVLAGILIVLLDHYELRKDKLSTTEANLILSRVPPFYLSRALNFLSDIPKLSQHKRSSIPAISLSTLDFRVLTTWYEIATTAINTFTSTPETTRIKRITRTSGRLIQDLSVTSETIREARDLLKQLREDGIVNNKLNSILTVVLHKNNLAVIAPSLRSNLLTALEKLGTNNCLSLAKIIKDAGQQKTYQERAIEKDLDSGSATNFPSIMENEAPIPALSLLERIKASKKQQQKDSADAFIALAKEAQDELEQTMEQTMEETIENEEEENPEEDYEEKAPYEELDFSDSFMRTFDEISEQDSTL